MNFPIDPDNTAVLWALIAVGTTASIWLEQNYKWAAKLSGPVLALLIAMVLTNVGIMPTAAPAYDFVGEWLVPLAIPLLLFRANLREIIKTGGRLFAIFHLSALGSLIGAFLAFFLLRSVIPSPDLESATGIMTASYVGGGVNFMAVKSSYDVDENIANPLIVADNFVMAGMFVALLAMGASKFFRARFPHPHSLDADDSDAGENLAAAHWKRKEIALLDVANSFAFAFTVLALSKLGILLMEWFFGDTSTAALPIQMLKILSTNQFVLLTLITLTLATVFAEPLSKINGPEEFGTFFLCIFLFTLGLPADLLTVLRDAPMFFVLCAIIALVNLAVTLIGGKLLKLNLEELIIVVNANLGGAPSAAAMAVSAGWSRLVVPGLLVGIWGYVIGTPTGILVYELLSR